MSFQHSSSTGLTISIGNVEVDIFVAQRTVARLLRGLQKTQLLRKSRCFGHWKSWDQYERIKEKTDVMVATKQLEFFVSTSLQEVRDMIGCDRATFFMVNPATHELWSTRSDGHRESFKIPKGSGIAGSTVEDKAPSNVRDAYRDPRFNSSFDLLSGYKTKSILCYPVFEVEEDLSNGQGAKNVIACVQLINKHNGVFTQGDEDTVEALCNFLARAMMMEDMKTDFPAVRFEFDDWSILQRKQLLTDRAHGNTIEVFLEQACLLSGAGGSRYVLSLEKNKKNKSSEVKGSSSLHEWHGTCQYSTQVTNATIQQSIKRAWNKKEAFMLTEHIDSFKFKGEERDSRRRSHSDHDADDMNLDNVVVIPLFLGSDYNDTNNKNNNNNNTKNNTKNTKSNRNNKNNDEQKNQSPSDKRRCVCVLEFERRLPDMDNQKVYVQKISQTITKLFNKFGKVLFDRALSNQSDSKIMSKLADIRSWVRMQMHKQARLRYEKAEVASVQRKYTSLNRTTETLKQQNDELRKKLQRSEYLLKNNKNEISKAKKERQSMEEQRDLITKQLIAVMPTTPQISVLESEKQMKRLTTTIRDQEKEIEKLKSNANKDNKKINETSKALDIAVTSISELEDRRKKDHTKLLDERKRKNSSEEQLRTYLSHVCRKLETSAFDTGTIFTKDAKMIDVTNLRDLLLQTLEAVLEQTKHLSDKTKNTQEKGRVGGVKLLMNEFANKLMAAETQLAFLPKCQKMLTESKRTLTTMQIKEQTRARKKEQSTFQMAVAKRHHTRKFLSSWRVWTYTTVRLRKNRNNKSLDFAVVKICARNVERRAFNKWFKYTDAIVLTRNKIYKALTHLKQRKIRCALNTWIHSFHNNRTENRNENKAKLCFTQNVLMKSIIKLKSFCLRRSSARKLIKRIVAQQIKSHLQTAMRLWERHIATSNSTRQQEDHVDVQVKLMKTIFNHRTLGSRFRQWVVNIERMRKEKRLLRRALSRITHRRLMFRLHIWQLYVVERKAQRKHVLHIFRNIDRQQCRKAWRKWVSCMEILELDKAHAKNIMKRWMQSGLLRMFNQWIQFTIESRKHKQLLNRAVRRILQMKLSASFHCWSNHMRNKKAASIQLVRILTRWDRKQEATAIRQWAYFATLKRKQAAVAQRVLSRWLQESMHRSFNRWRENATTHRIERQLVHRALSRFTQRHVAACFHSWRDAIIDLEQARSLLNRILTRWDRKQETNAFRDWAHLTILKREQSLVATRVLSRWLSEAKLRMFLTWRTNASTHRIERQVTQRALARFTQRHLASCFHGWKHTIETLVAARTKLNRILTRWDRKQETTAIRQWSYFAAMRKKQDNIAQRVLKRWLEESLHRSFSRWSVRAKELKVDRQLIRRVAIRLRNRKMSACFYGWRHTVSRLAIERRITRKALSRFVHQTISRCFVSWQAMTSDLKGARVRVYRILVRWDRKSEVRAFRMWSHATQQVIRQDAVVQRILFRWKSGLLHRSFNRWHNESHTKRMDRQLSTRALLKFAHKHLSTAFHGWKSETKDLMNARIKIVRILTRFNRKCTVEAFRKLVLHKRLAARQAAVAERIMWRWKHMTLVNVFHKWSRNTKEQITDRNLEKRAMKRLHFKRLMNHFQNWKHAIQVWITIRKLLITSIVRYDAMTLSLRFQYWKNKSNLWMEQQNVLYRFAVYKYGNHLKKLAFQQWTRVDRIQIQILRCIFTIITGLKRRLKSRAWSTWKFSVCGRQATQSYVAEYILAVSNEHRRKMTMLKKCWFVWSHASKLSVYQKRTAKHAHFEQWNLYVRRALYDRHEKLLDRFHRAGLRGSQAEIQWALGKWQQFAFCMQIQQVAALERQIFLKRIRGENKKLRKTLADYHSRGMFVLEGSKDYLVQRKIQPCLKSNGYESVNSMIESSYHADIPAGVKMDVIPHGTAFGRKTKKDRPKIPQQTNFVMDLLTPPKKFLIGMSSPSRASPSPPKTNNISSAELVRAFQSKRSPSPSELLAAFKEEQADMLLQSHRYSR